MSAQELSRPVSRAGRAASAHGAARRATPGRRAAPQPYEHDYDEWRGSIDFDRDAWATDDEANRLDEEPATEDGGWDG